MTRQDFAREKAKQRKNEAMKMASKRHKQRAKAVVDTPDYIKEIFSGNDMQQEQAEAPLSEKKSTVVEEVTSNNNAAGSIVKTKKSSGSILNSNKPYTQSSKPESFKSYSSSSSSSSKPNPFKAVLEAKRQEKIEANRARELAQIQRREQQQGRTAYYDKRKAVNSKLMRRTKKGQPVLSNLMDHLLTKIQAAG